MPATDQVLLEGVWNMTVQLKTSELVKHSAAAALQGQCATKHTHTHTNIAPRFMLYKNHHYAIQSNWSPTGN